MALKSRIPVLFGVLTTDTLEQALDRCGGKSGNKGCEVAHAALEMIGVMAEITSTSSSNNVKVL